MDVCMYLYLKTEIHISRVPKPDYKSSAALKWKINGDVIQHNLSTNTHFYTAKVI